MTPEEFEVRVADSAKAILSNYRNVGSGFSPDNSEIPEDEVFDFYHHILDLLKDKQEENPGIAFWLFKEAGEDLEHDKKFAIKLSVIEMFGQNLVLEKDIVAEYLKSLDKEKLSRIEKIDYFPIEVKYFLSKIFYENNLGTAPLQTFILFAGLKAKRLESRVIVRHSLEVAVHEFSEWFVHEYCEGDEGKFSIHANGDMNSLFVVNNLSEKNEGFEVKFVNAKAHDYQTYSKMLSKWCSAVVGVEAVLEIVAVKK